MKKPVFKPTLPPLVVVIVDSVLMIAGNSMPHWILGAILGGAIVWLVIAAIGIRGNIIERWPHIRDWFPFLDPLGGFATKAELSQKHVESQTLRLTDAATDGVIIGKTFDDCVIYGPAVIAPQGATMFRNPNWHGTKGDIIYDFGDMKTRTGMLLVNDCTFNNCTFYGIGVATPRDHFFKEVRIVGEAPPEILGRQDAASCG